MRDKIILDLDGTVTDEYDQKDYYDKQFDPEMLKCIEGILQSDTQIELFTARGMVSHKENILEIEKTHKSKLVNWLLDSGVNIKTIKFGKPYCGSNGFYVDDKALYVEDFKAKHLGPFSKLGFTIICPFFNEEENVKKTHLINLRACRLLHIKQFIYIDNGSSDGTKKYLDFLASKDHRVTCISVKQNIGYGGALKLGLKNSQTEHVIISHGDAQFDIYSTYRSLCLNAKHAFDCISIFPKRINRSSLELVLTFILRFTLSMIKLRFMREFNGQPKMLNINQLGNLDTLPNDFTIDLEFYLRNKDQKIRAYSYQSDRFHGKSSWNTGWLSRINLYLQYIKHAILR